MYTQGLMTFKTCRNNFCLVKKGTISFRQKSSYYQLDRRQPIAITVLDILPKLGKLHTKATTAPVLMPQPQTDTNGFFLLTHL